MAVETTKELQNLVIYEIYVRNHSSQGNFSGVYTDLERIKSMGVDVIWFMPVHPIGKLNKKGSLGCPYSISDYREINPEYGTKEEFSLLISRAHELGLKVMIDVVYNHTAHDSDLLTNHPEWYHQDGKGRPVTTVPEWSDVIDLKFPDQDLESYLIETLQMWTEFGIDGFRCDVASLLPVNFWLKARKAVSKIRPGVIWLAESVHAGWVSYRRSQNLSGVSDSELYQAFDLSYDYDIWPLWQRTVKGEIPAERYLEILRFQDCIYPANFVKMRCVENHDQSRIMKLAPSKNQALAWTAFQAFNKGAFLIYAGQEAAEDHTPSLFGLDKINWRDYPLQSFLTDLITIKNHSAVRDGKFILLQGSPAIQAVWKTSDTCLFGVFNVAGAQGVIQVDLPDGDYFDLISKTSLIVENGIISMPSTAFILENAFPNQTSPIFSPLLD